MRAVVTDSVSHQLSAMQPSKPLGNLLTFSESCCCCLVLTPWTAAHQASPSFTISRNVLKFMFTELVMPSTRLLFCFPLLPLPSVFPSIKVFSSELALHIRWPKYWNFSFSISLSNEYSELISFRMNCFDLLAVQGTLKSSPASLFESTSSSEVSILYGPALTSIHDYWKNDSFDYMDLCWQSNVSAF